MITDPHELYALANSHATHRHMGADLLAGIDWIPGAIACDQAAAERTYFGNIVASTARDLLAA